MLRAVGRGLLPGTKPNLKAYSLLQLYWLLRALRALNYMEFDNETNSVLEDIYKNSIQFCFFG